MRTPYFKNPGAPAPTRLSELGLSAMDVGKAAEHIVCADLIMSGYDAFLSDQCCPFDIVADVGDRLVRVQVKATLAPRNMNPRRRNPRIGYSWSVRLRGKLGQARRLDATHCDVIALVAMDVRAIAYFPVDLPGQTMQLDPPGVVGKQRTALNNWLGDVTSFPFEPAWRGDRAFYRRDAA